MSYIKKISIICFAAIVFAGCTGNLKQISFASTFSENTTPVNLNSYELKEENQIVLNFSGKVLAVEADAIFDKNLAIPCIAEEVISSKNEGEETAQSIFKLTVNKEIGIGEKFSVKGTAKISKSENLDFDISFTGLNKNPALLKLLEIKLGDSNKVGYIKLKAVKAGNLSGIELTNVFNKRGKFANYTFPKIDVKKDEEIVYRWFKPAEPELDSEHQVFYGNFESFTPTPINAILVKASEKGSIQDAILFFKKAEFDKKPLWEKQNIEEAAKNAADAGMWKPDASPNNAFIEKITPTKILKRLDLNGCSASAWGIK